jgi:hypothetical protein
MITVQEAGEAGNLFFPENRRPSTSAARQQLSSVYLATLAHHLITVYARAPRKMVTRMLIPAGPYFRNQSDFWSKENKQRDFLLRPNSANQKAPPCGY